MSGIMKKFKLTPKLIIIYTGLFCIMMILVTSIMYFYIQSMLEEKIEMELTKENELISKIISSSVDLSIKNHLKTITDINIDYIENQYENYTNGIQSEDEAKEKIFKYLETHKIGSTGYIYLLNSKGVIVDHPYSELIDNDLSQYDFIQNQMKSHDGYLEYEWRNPNELAVREKSLYMAYFEPWDWIVSTSSYKDEFYELINANDFEKIVSSIKFGETGYPIILSITGEFLVHPTYKGKNFFEESSDKSEIVAEVIKTRSGILEYDWKNPDDTEFQKKLMVFSEIEEYNWIIVSTAYRDEFYRPLTEFRRMIIVLFLSFILLITVITVKVSKMISKPVKDIESTIVEAINGNMTFELFVDGKDEIASLSSSFNQLIHSLEEKQMDLQKSFYEKNAIAEELEVLNNSLEEKVKKRSIELEESHKKIIRQEKMSSIYSLIQDLSHYINTPLGVSITSVSYIDDKIKLVKDLYYKNELSKKDIELFFDEYEKAYQLISSGMSRSSELIQMFRRLILSHESIREITFEVRSEIKKVLSYIKLNNHKVVLICPEDIELNGYPHIFKLIVELLIQNAIDHAFKQEKGIIKIKIEKFNNYFIMKIVDNGVGIREEELSKIMNPFYSTSSRERNLGLGLSIVNNAVKYILNGIIEIQSNEQGTSVIIRMPINE